MRECFLPFPFFLFRDGRADGEGNACGSNGFAWVMHGDCGNFRNLSRGTPIAGLELYGVMVFGFEIVVVWEYRQWPSKIARRGFYWKTKTPIVFLYLRKPQSHHPVHPRTTS